MSGMDAPLWYFELDGEAARKRPRQETAQFLELIGEEPETPVQEIPPEKMSFAEMSSEPKCLAKKQFDMPLASFRIR